MRGLLAAISRLGREAQFISYWELWKVDTGDAWNHYDVFSDQMIFYTLLPKNWEVLL